VEEAGPSSPVSAIGWSKTVYRKNGVSLDYASLSEPKEIFLKKHLGEVLEVLIKS
jgi:hypothetical protein